MLANKVSQGTHELINYAEESRVLPRWIHIVRFLPLATLLALVLYSLPWGIPAYVPAIVLALQLLLMEMGFKY